MSIESILKSRAAVVAILAITIAVAAAGRRAYGDEPVTLQQPSTTLVVKASAERSPLQRNESSIMRKESSQPRVALLQPAPAVAPAPAPARVAPMAQAAPAPVKVKQPAAGWAPFTPHYLCLCPPYCGKPMPCVDCCYKCCPDCYCSKPMPCPNPCYDCVCDDYCAKPMPCKFPQPLCGPCGPCRKTEPCPLYAPWPARGPCVTH